MATVRDLVELKLQKRLIEEELKKTDHKLDRLGSILHKKTLHRFELSAPADHKITNVGRTVSEFRLEPRRVKAIPRDNHYDPYATDASPMLNENIIRIRQDNALNRYGKTTVRRRLKEREESLIQKPPKKAPQIKIPESMLPNRYLRGELPCTIEHGTSGHYLSWACPLENLDYEYYLPLFFDGLQITEKVVSFIARQGIEDMLYASRGHLDRLRPVIPHLVRPLRNALSKFDQEVLLGVLKALEQLITSNEGVGEILLQYGRQFLTPMAYFLENNRNIGDAMDYGQRRRNDIGEEVRRVLELMEEHGGKDALRQIKFAIPLCKSYISFSFFSHILTMFALCVTLDESCMIHVDAARRPLMSGPIAKPKLHL